MRFLTIGGTAVTALLILVLAALSCPAQTLFHYNLPGNLTNQQPLSAATSPGPSFQFSPNQYLIATTNVPWTLCAPATGLGPFTYQWYKSGVPIPSQTSECISSEVNGSAVTLAGLSEELGGYYLVAQNAFGVSTSSVVTVSLDADGDRIPDAWELRYYPSLSNHPDSDTDGDNSTLIQEYQDDTNPTDRTSVLRKLIVQAGRGGNIIQTPLAFRYSHGQTVTLQATADPGYQFAGWTGNASGTNNPLSVLMTSSKTIQAIFRLPLPLGDAIEQPTINLQSSLPGWIPQSEVTHDGVDALQVRTGTDSALDGSPSAPSLSAEVTLAAPSIMTFWWKVSSDAGDREAYEPMSFNNPLFGFNAILGERDWTMYATPLKRGTNFLRWSFSPNHPKSSGIFQDLAWLDEVRIRPMASGPVWPTNLQTLTAGIAATGSMTLAYPPAGDFGVPPGSLGSLAFRAIKLQTIFQERFLSGSQDWHSSTNPSVGIEANPFPNSTSGHVLQSGSSGREFDGLWRTFTNMTPDWISFTVGNALLLKNVGIPRYNGIQGGHVALSDSVSLGSIAVFGHFANYGSRSMTFGLITGDGDFHGVYSQGQERVALKMNWTARMFDFYVDGLLIAEGVPFRDQSAATLGRMDLYNLDEVPSFWSDISFQLESPYPEAQVSSLLQTNGTSLFTILAPKVENSVVFEAKMPDGRRAITQPIYVRSDPNDLAVFAVTDKSTANVGERITFYAGARNLSASTVSNVFLTNTLPTGLQWISSAHTPISTSNDGRTRVFSLGPLKGEIEAGVLTFVEAVGSPKKLTNIFALAAAPLETNTLNNQISVVTEFFASPPVFVLHPVGGNFSDGNHTLSVQASGALPISYQWWFNDSPLVGREDSVLVLRPGTAQSGIYYATASNIGGTAVSRPARVLYGQRRSFVDWGAQWRYLDAGRNLRSAWLLPGYDDRDWKTGAAPLGYGDPMRTLVSFGDDANNKHTTTYFRKQFLVTNALAYADAFIDLVVDDGAVIYLNGLEIARQNMPPGPIHFTSWAIDNINGVAEGASTSIATDAGRLLNGLNTLAVEVHQVTNDSSDMRFDLRFSAELPLGGLPPEVTLLSPVDGQEFFAPARIALEAQATDRDGSVTNVTFSASGKIVAALDAAPFTTTWTASQPGSYTIIASARDNAGLSGSSVIARIEVVSPIWRQQVAVSGDLVTFTLLGAPFERYRIESSRDLLSWTDAGSLTTGAGEGSLSIRIDPARGAMFLRAVPGP